MHLLYLQMLVKCLVKVLLSRIDISTREMVYRHGNWYTGNWYRSTGTGIGTQGIGTQGIVYTGNWYTGNWYTGNCVHRDVKILRILRILGWFFCTIFKSIIV
jgi:hypothetical protein